MTIYVTRKGTADASIYRAVAFDKFEAQPSLPVIHKPTWTPSEGGSGAAVVAEVWL